MEMVDHKMTGGRKNWVIINDEGGCVQTMTKEDQEEMTKLLRKMKGAQVPINRDEKDFYVEVKRWKPLEDEEGYMKPKKTIKKKNCDPMEVGTVNIGKGQYGLLTIAEEEAYECQPCGGAWGFHRRW